MCALIEGRLSPRRERRARAHLRSCVACRQRYDRELRLRRLLAGDACAPTALEKERERRRVLQALGLLEAPVHTVKEPRSSPSLAWRIPAAVSALGLLLIGVIFAVQRQATPAPKPVAVLQHQRGVRIDGQAATDEQAILNGQRIEVSREGLAELRLLRGGELRVYPDSSLEIQRGGDWLLLKRGAVWSQIEPNSHAFEVHTPSAVAQVLGTSFVVEHRHQRTQVRVMRGQVRVRDRQHLGQVTLSDRQQSSVVAGTAPSPAHRYDPQRDKQAWQRFLQNLFRAIERGVRQGIKAISDGLRTFGRDINAP